MCGAARSSGRDGTTVVLTAPSASRRMGQGHGRGGGVCTLPPMPFQASGRPCCHTPLQKWKVESIEWKVKNK